MTEEARPIKDKVLTILLLTLKAADRVGARKTSCLKLHEMNKDRIKYETHVYVQARLKICKTLNKKKGIHIAFK